MAIKPLSIRLRNQRDAIFSEAPGLEATETLLDTISNVLFCVKDRARRYVAANQAFIERAGLRNRAALLGRTAREVFPEILAAGYEQQDDDIFSKNATVRDRLEMITQSDGTIGWFVSQKVAVRSVSGVVIALAGISRDLGTPAANGSELGVLNGILDKLHRDSAEPLRIETLAKQSGLSWSQFERRVRCITGLTPRQLLTKARIEKAAQALHTTDDSLSSIAIDGGFYDQAAFSRQFRAATGLTPSEYRRAFRSQ